MWVVQQGRKPSASLLAMQIQLGLKQCSQCPCGDNFGNRTTCRRCNATLPKKFSQPPAPWAKAGAAGKFIVGKGGTWPVLGGGKGPSGKGVAPGQQQRPSKGGKDKGSASPVAPEAPESAPPKPDLYQQFVELSPEMHAEMGYKTPEAIAARKAELEAIHRPKKAKGARAVMDESHKALMQARKEKEKAVADLASAAKQMAALGEAITELEAHSEVLYASIAKADARIAECLRQRQEAEKAIPGIAPPSSSPSSSSSSLPGLSVVEHLAQMSAVLATLRTDPMVGIEQFAAHVEKVKLAAMQAEEDKDKLPKEQDKVDKEPKEQDEVPKEQKEQQEDEGMGVVPALPSVPAAEGSSPPAAQRVADDTVKAAGIPVPPGGGSCAASLSAAASSGNGATSATAGEVDPSKRVCDPVEVEDEQAIKKAKAEFDPKKLNDLLGKVKAFSQKVGKDAEAQQCG